MKSKPTRRGRRAPSEPYLTSPLSPSHSPFPLECDVDDDGGVCSHTHQQHQEQHTHQQHIARHITREWAVIGAQSLIKRYGIAAVSEIAVELHDAALAGLQRDLNNPGGFFVWKVRELAKANESNTSASRGRLRAVGESDA